MQGAFWFTYCTCNTKWLMEAYPICGNINNIDTMAVNRISALGATSLVCWCKVNHPVTVARMLTNREIIIIILIIVVRGLYKSITPLVNKQNEKEKN